MTMGADRPPYGTRQRKFSPLRAHLSMRPVSREMPSRLGPRISGQSPTATRRGPSAVTEIDAASSAAAATQDFIFGMATNIRRPGVVLFNAYRKAPVPAE